MKKVVLLGDSIRLIGYGTVVPGLLEGRYKVWQPSDNCRFASYTLRMLYDYRDELKNADIIHWNNGLWDECNLFGDSSFTPLEVYADTLKRIASILKNITDKVIFATTTPVTPLNPHNSNETISKFNSAAVNVLAPLGVRINDLYSLVLPKTDIYIRKDDNIHLTAEGCLACARQVADEIKRIDS